MEPPSLPIREEVKKFSTKSKEELKDILASVEALSYGTRYQNQV